LANIDTLATEILSAVTEQSSVIAASFNRVDRLLGTAEDKLSWLRALLGHLPSMKVARSRLTGQGPIANPKRLRRTPAHGIWAALWVCLFHWSQRTHATEHNAQKLKIACSVAIAHKRVTAAANQ
jgi:hypothetical protein